MNLLPIPFAPGMDQSTDPAFAPPGALVRAENVRPTRDGRLAKRRLDESISLVTPSAAPFDGVPQFVAERSGSNLVAASGSLWLEGPTGAVREVGQLPRGTPIRMRDVHHTARGTIQSAELSVARCTQLYHAGMLFVAYEYTEGGSQFVRIRTLDWASGAVVREDTMTGAQRPMLILLDGQVRLFSLVSGGNSNVQQRTLSLTGAAPGANSAVNDTNNTSRYSVCPATATQFALLRVTSAGVLQLRRYAPGATPTWTTQIATGINISNVSVDVAADFANGGNLLYVAWSRTAVNTSFWVGLSGNGSVVSTSGITQVSHSLFGQPYLSCPAGTSGATLIWTTDQSGWGPSTSVGTISTAGTFTLLNQNIPNLWPCSRAFGVDGRRYFMATSGAFYQGEDAYYCLFEVNTDPFFWSHLRFEHVEPWPNPGQFLSIQPCDVQPTPEGWLWTYSQIARTGFPFSGEFQHFVTAWEFSLVPQKRRPFEVDGVLMVPGGELTEFDGELLAEVGFVTYPGLAALGGATGGQLTPSQRYQACLIWERIDAAGRVHRSPPSVISGFTLGAAQNRLEYFHASNSSIRHRAPHSAHFYRTLGNGSVFHRTTEYGAGVLFSPTVDNLSDNTLSNRPILYTEGGVLPYHSAPASRFGCLALGRVWLGGLFRSHRVVCSTELVRSEAPGFPWDASHWLDFPEPITGLSSLENDLVVFSERSIWLVAGEGPTITGLGAFLPPRRLPTDLGCVDWRSVVETSVGVFYQGQSGIMLLPRGGNASPVYIGQAIADELAAHPYVIAAEVFGEGDSAVAKFLLADDATTPASSEVVSYHLRTGSWSVDELPSPLLSLGHWFDRPTGQLRPAYAAPDVFDGIYVEGDSATPDAYIPTRLVTGEIAPAGYGAEFRAVRFWIRCTYRGPCTLRISVLYDEQTAPADVVQWDLDAPLTPGVTVRREWRPRRQQCTSLRLIIEDLELGSNPTSRGVDYIGLTLEWEPVGPQQLQTAARK